MAEQTVLMFLPYPLLVASYFVIFTKFIRLTPETITLALVKALPIWLLIAYIQYTPSLSTNPLAVWVRVGLVLSSLGDICLVWRHSLFLPGMFCFALAQIAYIYGMMDWMQKGSYPNGNYVWSTAVVCVVLYILLFSRIKSWGMAVCVLVYSVLIFAMANLALQRHLIENNFASLCGVMGALFFLVSDFLIGVSIWMASFPMAGPLIMITYYVAQGAIAFGAVNAVLVKQGE